MNGHELIIAERIAGYAPAWVYVNDYPCQTNWEKYGDIPQVCTHGDNIHRLDLRFLRGLKVNASSPIESRAKQLFEAVKAVGVALVTCGHIQIDKSPSQQDGWFDVYFKEVA